MTRPFYRLTEAELREQFKLRPIAANVSGPVWDDYFVEVIPPGWSAQETRELLELLQSEAAEGKVCGKATVLALNVCALWRDKPRFNTFDETQYALAAASRACCACHANFSLAPRDDNPKGNLDALIASAQCAQDCLSEAFKPNPPLCTPPGTERA